MHWLVSRGAQHRASLEGGKLQVTAPQGGCHFALSTPGLQPGSQPATHPFLATQTSTHVHVHTHAPCTNAHACKQAPRTRAPTCTASGVRKPGRRGPRRMLRTPRCSIVSSTATAAGRDGGGGGGREGGRAGGRERGGRGVGHAMHQPGAGDLPRNHHSVAPRERRFCNDVVGHPSEP